MMFKTKVIKYLVCTIVLVCSYTFLQAQNSSAKNDIGLYFSPVNLSFHDESFSSLLPSLQLRYVRNVSEYLCLGASLGYGYYDENELVIDGNTAYFTYVSKHSNSLHYSFNAKMKLLPFFNVKSTRFDLYLIGDLGGISLNTTIGEHIEPRNGNYLDASLLGGLGFYFSKSIGLFVETGYKYFEYHKGFIARYGLSVRF